MAYNFDLVEILQYDHAPLRFGNDFRYAIEKQLSINGVLANYTNGAGISGIINKQELLLRSANDYDDIILNGVSFGSGKITSIKFEDNNLIRDNRYSFEITCLESGNLFNAVSGYYSGINWDSNTKLIDAFDESLSYSKDADGVQNYSHNIQVRYNRQFPALTGINLGKIFAQNLFNSSGGLFPFLGQYNNLNQYKRLYAETYNLIDRGCGFSAAAKILPNATGGYSYSLNYNLTLGEDGYCNIDETCDIQGVFAPRAAWSETGYNTLITGAFNRVNQVYSGYAFSALSLFSQPLEKSVATNKYEGKKTFSHRYSNNPRYQSGAIWEYQDEVQKDSAGYVTVTEQGSIKGYGRPSKDKYNSAYNFYNLVAAPGIDGRLSGLYVGFELYPKTLQTIKESFVRNEIAGEISYSREKTDNNLYIDVSGIKKSEVDVSISYPVHLFQNFSVFNQRELEQSQYTCTQGNVSISVKLRGKRTSVVQNYLDFCRPIITQYATFGTDTYLEGLSYDTAPLSNSFNMNANYKFISGYKLSTDLKLS